MSDEAHPFVYILMIIDIVNCIAFSFFFSRYVRLDSFSTRMVTYNDGVLSEM